MIVLNNIKKKHDVALLTIFHDKILRFTGEYFEAIKKQRFPYYDLFIMLDSDNNFIVDESCGNIFIARVYGSIAKIREIGIKYIKELGYKYLIFLDGDDLMPNNRIEKLVELLNNYKIIVNDLSLFGDYCADYYISRRNCNLKIILNTDINEINFLGLSNTAINLNIIDDDFFLPDDIYAVDWYIFTLLLKKGYSAVFTNETHTKYRIWGENLFSKFDEKHFEKIIKIKYLHYKYLVERENFVEYYYLYHYFCKLNELFDKNSENTFKIEIYNYFKNKYEKIQNPLWLEEVTYDEYIKNQIDR